MKKFFLILLFLMMSVMLSSCKEEEITIGVLIYNEDDSSLQEIEGYIKNNINENYQLLIYDASSSQSIQNDQFLELLELEVNIILVNLVDRLTAKVYIEKCKNTNTKLIFFDREPLYDDLLLDEDIYYVGPDSKGFGILQAKMLRDVSGAFSDPVIAIDKNNDSIIQIVFIKGEQGHQLTEYITNTCISEIISKKYKIQVLATEFTDGKRETSKAKIEKIYERFGNQIEVLIANSDDLALGVIDFVFENNLDLHGSDGKVYMPFEIIGANATEESISEITNGYIYGSVINDRQKQAEVIIDLIEYLLGHQERKEYSDECVAGDEADVCVSQGRLIYVTGTEISKKTMRIK